MAARPVPRGATAEAVAAPALRLVDHSARPRRRALTRAATVLASALAATGLFGVVSLHVFLAQGQAELDALHARADAAVTRNGQLTVGVAELEAPGRVVGWARGHLGMVPLAAVTYLPAADPAAPLPPVPEGPLPTPTPAATPTMIPPTAAATPATAVTTVTEGSPSTPTTKTSPSTTATTVARHQAPSSTVVAKQP